MAGTARYTAILDANVMFPVNVFDILAQFCIEGLFTAKWSQDIDDEWTRNLLESRADLTQDQVFRRRDKQRIALPDWDVEKEKYQSLIEAIYLPDLNDRHVLAAAIAGHADSIVTFNIKDFPNQALDQYDIEAIHPDDFICHQLDLMPYQALTAIKHIRSRLKNPPYTADDLLDIYKRSGLIATVAKLKDAIELI
jgi:predicted nucleic acid-binding protein